jgi:hypothetical protein
MWFDMLAFLIIVIGSSTAFGIGLYFGTPSLAQWLRDREVYHIKYPDGTECTMTRKEIMAMKPHKQNKEADVEFLRKILKNYDDGNCTAGEISALLMRRNMEEFITALKTHGEYGVVSSWCGPTPPPPETFNVKIVYGADQLWLTKIEE